MTFDTNILIAYLDGEEEVVTLVNKLIQERKLLFLPATVEIELLSFSHWKPEEVRDVEDFLAKSFVFVPADRNISRLAAKLRRTIKIKTPDAIIAATAIATNTPLVTRNLRDFKNIPDLVVQTI